LLAGRGPLLLSARSSSSSSASIARVMRVSPAAQQHHFSPVAVVSSPAQDAEDDAHAEDDGAGGFAGVGTGYRYGKLPTTTSIEAVRPAS